MHGLQALFFRLGGDGSDGAFGVGHQGGVAFGFGHFDHAGGVGQLILKASDGAERGVEFLAFAHQLLRGLRIIPQAGVFGLGVQFVQAAVGDIPVKDASSAGQWPA